MRLASTTGMAPPTTAGGSARRIPSGVWLLVGIAAALVVLVLAAYHGSSQTPPSDCTRWGALLSRTAADAASATRSDSATGALPARLLAPIEADGARLTDLVENEQSDLTFDERVLPVTDAITQLAADAPSPSRTRSDLGTLTAAIAGADRYCGIAAPG